jgi:hypothetical protein
MCSFFITLLPSSCFLHRHNEDGWSCSSHTGSWGDFADHIYVLKIVHEKSKKNLGSWWLLLWTDFRWTCLNERIHLLWVSFCHNGWMNFPTGSEFNPFCSLDFFTSRSFVRNAPQQLLVIHLRTLHCPIPSDCSVAWSPMLSLAAPPQSLLRFLCLGPPRQSRILFWVLCSWNQSLDPRPKLLGFHVSGPSPHPYTPNKKAEKGGLLHGSGHAVGRGRVSTQLIFSHLWGTHMSCRFK